jgi:hypothetical protein
MWRDSGTVIAIAEISASEIFRHMPDAGSVRRAPSLRDFLVAALLASPGLNFT